jgi:hypothetical protein
LKEKLYVNIRLFGSLTRTKQHNSIAIELANQGSFHFGSVFPGGRTRQGSYLNHVARRHGDDADTPFLRTHQRAFTHSRPGHRQLKLREDQMKSSTTLLITCCTVFLAQLGMSIYLSALPDIARDLTADAWVSALAANRCCSRHSVSMGWATLRYLWARRLNRSCFFD